MPKYTGTLAISESYSDRIGQIKDLFSTYLSDVFTLDSDSGTGNARVLKYVIPHNTRKLSFSYNSSYADRVNVYLRNLADTANVGSVSYTDGYSVALQYIIVKNENSGYLKLGGTNFTWGTLGSKGFCTFGTNLYPISGSDVVLKGFINSYQSIPYIILSNGQEIFLPTFVFTDDNATYYPYAVPDIFAFKNTSQSVAINASFYIGTTEFIVISTQMCIRVN